MADTQASVQSITQTTTQRPEGLVRTRGYPAWLNGCAQKLQAAASLSDNWDSYGSLRTNSLSLTHANVFLERLAKTVSVLEPMIAVNAAGNICFEWDKSQWLMTVEVTPRGIANYYYENSGRELEIEGIDKGEYKTIIQYLTGH